MSRIGRYLPYGVAALARIGGRYEPAGRYLQYGVTSRVGRYVPYGVAVLARVGDRYEPCWPLCAC